MTEVSVRPPLTRPAQPTCSVSVILATNRRIPFMRDALDSVVGQSFDDWELVLVDDGSPDPDSLEEFIAGIPHSRVIHQPPRGLSQARNAGCAVAEGAYVTFLDDDDYWPSDRLHLQMDAVSSAPSDVIGCFGNLDYVDGRGRILGKGPVPETKDAEVTAGFHIGTVMVRTEALFRAGLFNPFLEAADDIDFLIRLAKVGNLVHVPSTLLYYRRHDSNTTNARISTNAYGRAVYEHYYRLTGMTGDRNTHEALARTITALERYMALSAARAARALLGDRRYRAAAMHSLATWDSTLTACRYRFFRPSHKSGQW